MQTKRRNIAILLAVVLAAGLAIVWMNGRGKTGEELAEKEEVPAVEKESPPPSVKKLAFEDERFAPLPTEEEMVRMDSEIEEIPDHRFYRLADGRTVMTEAYGLMRRIHTEEFEAFEDLDVLDAIMGAYRWAFRTNPEGGSNREIMESLMGANPKRLVFIPPDHPDIDSQGRLLDRWGEPYKFHKISDQSMDIISNGPDRRLWTEDDLDLGRTAEFNESSLASDS